MAPASCSLGRLALFLYLFSLLGISYGFLSPTTTAPPTTTKTTPNVINEQVNNNNRAVVTCLSAVKKKKGKAPAPSVGAGFGRAAAAPSVSSGISGQSGSGSKVLRKATNNYDRIRKEYAAHDGGVQAFCRDVYVRSPLNSETTLWFVGKVAREPKSKITRDNDNDTADEDDHKFFNEAALALKRLILDYSRDQLRPQNMGGKYASALEVWLAAGDSEMDVATNKASLEKVTGNAARDLPDAKSWDFNAVGYDPEIYLGDEVTKGGLRVE
eukprot:CAMPEP_0198151872 /NCGR_PEP_ID=MMETSP1443-20131203/57504_1 /TAXON_ID=186043 /ORGANISM="Entomoneis sp., Strain CCMP2396" /LENGTH=269 /DNA_ID=CAMNT_0043817707 /DNA_START=60 /DNA_END=866 /DNA_ORIENTATION=-